MENYPIEELLKIVSEYLKSEEGNLSGAVDLAVNFSTKNSIPSDFLLALSNFCGSNGFYELTYVFAKATSSSSIGFTKAKSHYTAGVASALMGCKEEAEQQYKLSLQEDPKDAETHLSYGILLEQMGRKEEAEQQYKLALQEDPKNAATHSNYGILLEQMGQKEEAEQQYKLALQEDPKNAVTHSNYGILLEQMGRKEEAEQQYELALKEDPNDASTHLNYGILLLEMGRQEEAEQQIKFAIELDPYNANAHYNYGILLAEMGRKKEAEQQYELALKENPSDASTHLNYGILLLKVGRQEEAEQQIKFAIELNPNHASAHYNYGIFLSEMERKEEAEQQYKLALQADPKNAAIYSNYGILLKQMGRLEEAEEQIKISIELDPKKPYGHGAYGSLLLSKNIESKAIEELEIASHLFGENGDRVKEHLSLALLYETLTNKYYSIQDYQKSGEYAEISGDRYIEAGKQAGREEEKFKSTSLTKGYTLKGRAKIRKLELKPPYDVEMFTEIMDGIYEASKCYKKAAEASPKDNQTCNACSISMLCLSEILDYMIAVIKQKKVPKLEDEIEKWKKELAIPEEIYKGSGKGENFIKSLYKLMACIQNLEGYKKYGMRKEERSFEECIGELREITGNIEGPLQKIIDDSAKQMDICRRKIMPYAGIETGKFEPQTSKIEITDTSVEPKQDDVEKFKDSKKINGILKWIFNHPIKSAGSVIFAVILNHYTEDLFFLLQGFVSMLFS